MFESYFFFLDVVLIISNVECFEELFKIRLIVLFMRVYVHVF